VKELQYNRVRGSEDAAALREAEEALQQAEEQEEKSAMQIADMTAQLRERSAELADAQDRLSRATQTAEDLRLQLFELQQRGEEEERGNQHSTPTPHESHGPRDSLTCMPYAVTECGKESSPSPTHPATSTRSFSDCQGPHVAAQRTVGEEEKREGVSGLPQLTEMQATKMRIRELEAGNIWLERERKRLTDLLQAYSLSRSPSTALSNFSDSSSASHARSLHVVQAARKHAGDSDEKEQVSVDKGEEAVRQNSPTRGTTQLVPGDEDVEAAVEAAVEEAECRADAAVDALLTLKEALVALCRKVQALERQLVASQEVHAPCLLSLWSLFVSPFVANPSQASVTLLPTGSFVLPSFLLLLLRPCMLSLSSVFPLCLFSLSPSRSLLSFCLSLLPLSRASARTQTTDANGGQAQYLCEDELQRSCETVEQLRGVLQEVLNGRRGHSLQGGVVGQEGSRRAEEEEIEEMVSDGVCATAERLRRQLAVLQQSVLNLAGQGRQAAEKGLSMQEREQGECNAGAWRSCGGRCDSAERLRHQVLSPSLAPSPLSLSTSSSPFPLPPPFPPVPPRPPLSVSQSCSGWGGEEEELDVRCRDASGHVLWAPRIPWRGIACEAEFLSNYCRSGLQTIAAPASQLTPCTSCLPSRTCSGKAEEQKASSKLRSKSPALAQQTRSPLPPPPNAPPPRLCQLEVSEARCDDAELENEVSRHGQEMTQAPGTLDT